MILQMKHLASSIVWPMKTREMEPRRMEIISNKRTILVLNKDTAVHLRKAKRTATSKAFNAS